MNRRTRRKRHKDNNDCSVGLCSTSGAFVVSWFGALSTTSVLCRGFGVCSPVFGYSSCQFSRTAVHVRSP